jgi:hypothetical protein
MEFVLCWRKEGWAEGVFHFSNKIWTDRAELEKIAEQNRKDYPDRHFWIETLLDAEKQMEEGFLRHRFPKKESDLKGFLEWADNFMERIGTTTTAFREKIIALRLKYHGIDEDSFEVPESGPRFKRLEHEQQTMVDEFDKLEQRIQSLEKTRDTGKKVKPKKFPTETQDFGKEVLEESAVHSTTLLGKLEIMDKSAFRLPIRRIDFSDEREGIAQARLANDDRQEEQIRQVLLGLTSHVQELKILEDGTKINGFDEHEIIYYLEDDFVNFKLMKKAF